DKMEKYLKIGVLIIIIIGLGFALFYPKWPHLKEIYTSPELRERLSPLPEDVHRLTPGDESDTRPFSMGYASFVLPQDATAFLCKKERGVYDSIWLYDKQVMLHFGWPSAVNNLYKKEYENNFTNMTKTEWRQSRLLKATDCFDHTLIAIPDLVLYYFQEIPLSYPRVFFMSISRFANHIWRLKAKLERSPPYLERVVPFESEHVVGVVFLGHVEKSGNSGFVYLASCDRKIEQTLTFMYLPKNSTDKLEPIWQVLSGYKFNVDTCPDDTELIKMIDESEIPVINNVVKDGRPGFKDIIDLDEFVDILLSEDVYAAAKFIDDSIINDKAVDLFKGDEVFVLKSEKDYVKIRKRENATEYWTFRDVVENEYDQVRKSGDNGCEPGLSPKPKDADVTH
ncbi:hypothetical protein K8T06_15825, partial [bacterium]|nr:hypothetical protein [bacterium]